MYNLDYLGTALKSPINIVKGKPTIVSGSETVRQAIERLLGTPRGTVFFNRQYGSRIDELLFESNDTILIQLLRQFIFEAIRDWEPRVKFISIETLQESDKILCSVKYRILASNEVDALVYPFYRTTKY